MNTKPIKILSLEDVPTDAELIRMKLLREGLLFEWLSVDNEADFKRTLQTFAPDIVLADYTLPAYDGRAALQYLQETHAHVPLIVVTGTLDEEKTVELLRNGAVDFVLKDRLGRLPDAIRQALNNARLEKECKLDQDRLLKLSLAVEQSPITIIITNLQAEIEFVNAAFTSVSGYSFAEVLGKNPRMLRSGKTPVAIYQDMWATLSAGKAWRGELINRHKEGSEYIESVSIAPVRQPDGRISNYLAIKENITDRKVAEARIEKLTNFDQLTGLPNRTLLEDRITIAIAHAAEHGRFVGVIFLNFDVFHAVNDVLGHRGGDHILISTAERLVKRFRHMPPCRVSPPILL
ncbi:MAG: PAS domain S-box protein [Gallionellaceae bacterium]|jgi:PAS domain S-box-containing protein